MIVITENDYIPKELEEYIKENKSLHPYFETNFDGTKPKNYCGFLNIAEKSYFITPKITTNETQNLNTFIYMLIYAYDIKLSNEDLAIAKNQEHSIFEVFIRLFVDELLSELKKGDQIVTTGGLMCEVVKPEEDFIKVKLNEDTIVKLAKEFISRKQEQEQDKES